MEVMRIMVTSFKVSHAPTSALSALTLKQTTANPRPHWRLLDTHGQIWVSLLWGHCSFLLCPGAHKVLFVSSKSLFPWSCVSSGGSMVGLTVTSSNRVYGIPRSAALRGPATAVGHYRAVPPEETLKQFWLCLCGVSGSWYAQGVYEPSEHLWWVCDLILNAIFPHLPSY